MPTRAVKYCRKLLARRGVHPGCRYPNGLAPLATFDPTSIADSPMGDIAVMASRSTTAATVFAPSTHQSRTMSNASVIDSTTTTTSTTIVEVNAAVVGNSPQIARRDSRGQKSPSPSLGKNRKIAPAAAVKVPLNVDASCVDASATTFDRLKLATTTACKIPSPIKPSQKVQLFSYFRWIYASISICHHCYTDIYTIIGNPSWFILEVAVGILIEIQQHHSVGIGPTDISYWRR